MAEGDLRSLLPHMRLDELLAELQTRLEDVLATRDRVHSLLEAVVSVGSDLDLETVLRRMVEAAVKLVDARYGALGVIGDGNTLMQFIPVGITEEEIAEIEHWPHGKGLLGLLIKNPQPLRLPDIADHPESYGFPPGHPPMRTFLGVPIRVRDEVFGNLYLTEKIGGGIFEEEDEAIVSALATAAGVAIENARLYEETRRRETWLQISAELTTGLLSGTDVRHVLAVMARRTREMTDADTVTIGFPRGENLRVEIADGFGDDSLRGREGPIEGTLAGDALRTGHTQTTDDINVREPDSALLGGLSLGPALGVPLTAGRQVQGVLGLFKLAGRQPFGESDRRMVQTLAGQAGVALELAEVRKDAERLHLLEDRDRIAKDLHDLVIQRLFAVAMTLMSTVRLVDDPTGSARLQHAVDELDETIRQIRSTIFALQTPAHDTAPGLRAQIMELVESARGHLGFMPGVRMEGAIDTTVPADIGDQLLAVLREALSNVVRHARAKRVDILAEAGEELLLQVEDDGVGLPAGGHRSGLRNMRERAEDLGGTFTAARRDPGGTRLVWRIPLSPGERHSPGT
ncbi:sensor histidine kinase [Sinosporangium siamense]|uniref:Histidine kinase n=1 Tax=Sinosporangium siamense TaxID=1367973 RepID=A0A919V6L9_9ACTN|nr:GAF domain-containing protein [Sinosporangium siamense]GII92131.1 histidine kinase [Sinosporangium siamense]